MSSCIFKALLVPRNFSKLTASRCFQRLLYVDRKVAQNRVGSKQAKLTHELSSCFANHNSALFQCRGCSSKSHNESEKEDLMFKNKTVMIYVTALGILVVGLSYAAVPLYRVFCQTTGRGGHAVAQGAEKVETMKKGGRQVTVRFNADTTSSMRWMFHPQQSEITLVPGETALAFYTATNPTDSPIDGIATYNVVPYDAGQYFMKIQCFCFEEQRLNPHEQVDMPVFFYIDPEFNEDPRMENLRELTLSYTFFESKDDVKFKLPSFS